MIYNNNVSLSINTDTSLLDFSNIVKIISNNISQLNYVNTKNLTTDILENNHIFNLNSAEFYYNVNNNNTEIIIDNNNYCFDIF